MGRGAGAGAACTGGSAGTPAASPDAPPSRHGPLLPAANGPAWLHCSAPAHPPPPPPLPPRSHTARFLVIWLALLPFSIYAQCGWVTVFSSVVLGFFLLSIEEIGVTIEEPFNILPLEVGGSAPFQVPRA